MLNKTLLIGNVGADVETRYTKTQVTVATFRVATTERWKDNDGKAPKSTGKEMAWGMRQTEVFDEGKASCWLAGYLVALLYLGVLNVAFP
jgi:single-stranded DNA-binding protein